MKNIGLILILAIFLYSCDGSKEKKEINQFFSQDFKKFKTDGILEVIGLDTVSNFSELRKMMGEITCNKKASGLKFELSGTLYHMTAFSNCPSSGGGCYFRRNIITIRNDSLIVEYGEEGRIEPIEYLKAELEDIISKPYNYQYNEEKVKPALIHLFIEDKYPISITKKVLGEIARQFENINSVNGADFFKYHILFEKYDITSIKIPPPPPPPKDYKTDYGM